LLLYCMNDVVVFKPKFAARLVLLGRVERTANYPRVFKASSDLNGLIGVNLKGLKPEFEMKCA
jgi:hypothetical protein